MAIYSVFQGETYDLERAGGYVWSPQLNNKGHKNAGYTMMTKIRKGDYILHHSDQKILSISIAKEDYYTAEQPSELSKANTTVQWNDDGYRVDTEYFDFDLPVDMSKHRKWLAAHNIEGSAFDVNGNGKTQYMCHLADEHAIYLLNKAIALQKNTTVLKHLKAALDEVVNDKESEYDLVEMESINNLVEDSIGSKSPKWEGKKEKQPTKISTTTGREIPVRDPQRAADALAHAKYLCEFNNKDKTFLRKKGTPYTEPHHLIPMSRYKDFPNGRVDTLENIVSLCSHCHNLLHYGRFEDKKPILEKLYNERIDALRKCGLYLTLEQLESYYK